MDDKWLNVDDVAEQIKVHPETIRRWLRDGKLKGVLISRAAGYRIRQSALDALLNKAEEMGKAAA
jgi:excisionase family DNA binding protein